MRLNFPNRITKPVPDSARRCVMGQVRQEYMSESSTLGYMVLNASDLDQWESFATQVFGLQVSSRTADELRLRMDEREQRLIIERGSEDDLSALGWEFD